MNAIKNNKFANATLNNKIDIFKEIKNIRGNTNNKTNVIDGNTDSESISNHFKDIYRDLYSSVPSDEKVQTLLNEIKDNIGDSDLDIVDKVNPILIKEAIEKMKRGKSDVTYDFGSDGFLNASDVLASPISFLFKAFLVHGYIPTFLLICSLVPLVKDKLGDLSNSDNYRAIAISSLFLKIFDWMIILLYSDQIKTSDLQFGFQEKSSTTMCSWMLTEVISYYNGIWF